MSSLCLLYFCSFYGALAVSHAQSNSLKTDILIKVPVEHVLSEHDDGVPETVLLAKRPAQITDNGYGSRVKAGSQLARALLTRTNIYGSFGPGKRSDSRTVLPINRLSKKYSTDYGYGSRVDAGSDMAFAQLANDGIYGSWGPGKRSGFKHVLPVNGLSKKYSTDYGYGSRIDAGSNVALANLANDGIYGSWGPGKRFVLKHVLPVNGLSKKYSTDYGYGSRVDAGSDMAFAQLANEGIYGSSGPGKRSGVRHILPVNGIIKRYLSDYGYGSRIDAGSDMALAHFANEGVFGSSGPGKRSGLRHSLPVDGLDKRYLSDYGYGSRIDAGSDLALAQFANEGIFGSSGPGKRSQNTNRHGENTVW